jgi:hypothetical protein
LKRVELIGNGMYRIAKQLRNAGIKFGVPPLGGLGVFPRPSEVIKPLLRAAALT